LIGISLTALQYPAARRGEVKEVHHGVAVPDPYRWLEAMDAPETRAWVKQENALTDTYLAAIPGRQRLKDRIRQLLSYERFGLPSRLGSRYFWSHQDGKQNQRQVFTAASLEEAPRLLLDPNAISPDGRLAFAGLSISEDGARIAYGLAAGGGDWTTWRLRDVDSGKDLPDQLEHLKYYGPAFTADHRGVYYSRFPAPPADKELTETDHDHRLYFHRIGTPVAQDTVVYQRPDHPTWQFDPTVTRDGRYLVVSIGDGEVGDRRQEQIVYRDLRRPGTRMTPLIDEFDFEYVFIGNDGPVFYFVTTWGAPRKRIIGIDTRTPARDRWQVVVPEGPHTIEDASMVARQIVVRTMVDAHTAVSVYDLGGKKRCDLPLPGLGTASGFRGGPADIEMFYSFTSFTVPGAIYRVNLACEYSKLWKAPAVAFDGSQLETRQVFYPSKDGTKVPMFITAKKGLAPDGSHPTVVTGYGFGGVPSLPSFNAPMVAWLERGGVYVLANIRGGGEYGEAWHHASYRTHRQVGLDDFIAAGEWLVKNRITSPAHLGIMGGSGGGMLVGAVTMQRPDLYGATVPIAGVHDLLRFHLFGEGAGWQGDMGSPDDPADFKALYAYSPLHNVRPGVHYPPTLVVTSDHDVRVAPLHSYKLAAALQSAQSAPAAPILLRVQTTTGHGFGSTLPQRIDQQTEILSFLAKNLGLPLE
jgi:prolyl oligopeptidase